MSPVNPGTKEMDETTVALIRNLKQMGCLGFAISDIFGNHLVQWCLKKHLLPHNSFTKLSLSHLGEPQLPLLVKFLKEKDQLGHAIHSLCELHLQKWCIENGIVTNDYIANISIECKKT